METLNQVQDKIQHLPPQDILKLKEWLDSFIFDHKIEQTCDNNVLKSLAIDALQEFKSKKARSL